VPTPTPTPTPATTSRNFVQIPTLPTWDFAAVDFQSVFVVVVRAAAGIAGRVEALLRGLSGYLGELMMFPRRMGPVGG